MKICASPVSRPRVEMPTVPRACIAADFVAHERAVAAVLVGARTSALDDEVRHDAVEGQAVVVARAHAGRGTGRAPAARIRIELRRSKRRPLSISNTTADADSRACWRSGCWSISCGVSIAGPCRSTASAPCAAACATGSMSVSSGVNVDACAGRSQLAPGVRSARAGCRARSRTLRRDPLERAQRAPDEGRRRQPPSSVSRRGADDLIRPHRWRAWTVACPPFSAAMNDRVALGSHCRRAAPAARLRRRCRRHRRPDASSTAASSSDAAARAAYMRTCQVWCVANVIMPHRGAFRDRAWPARRRRAPRAATALAAAACALPTPAALGDRLVFAADIAERVERRQRRRAGCWSSQRIEQRLAAVRGRRRARVHARTASSRTMQDESDSSLARCRRRASSSAIGEPEPASARTASRRTSSSSPSARSRSVVERRRPAPRSAPPARCAADSARCGSERARDDSQAFDRSRRRALRALRFRRASDSRPRAAPMCGSSSAAGNGFSRTRRRNASGAVNAARRLE